MNKVKLHNPQHWTEERLYAYANAGPERNTHFASVRPGVVVDRITDGGEEPTQQIGEPDSWGVRIQLW
ncbi:hypothetical protein [Agrilutibacter solisilvae]|uniref:Uncharacterized protein n=1 Tax=Agrilutibacter solisilvae TaxID=2763317 RepID=A0A975ARY3_9GAMM|nr:hypothetical protein [Lysobacter solisilvae]QSX77514.1 hypothetical protein I8J32_012210 [Lysobacter solisilvae]